MIACFHSNHSCTTLDRPTGRAGSGRVRKLTGNGGSGRVGWLGSGRGLEVQFGQKLKFNFTLKCLGICILFCILVCTMFQLYIQYIQCNFQCILDNVTDGEYLSAVASRWHDYCSLHQLRNAKCRHQCRRLSRCFTASCGGRRASAVCIPLLVHLSCHKNINVPKLDYHDSLRWTGRKRRAGASEALSVPSRAVVWHWYCQIQWHCISNWQRWSHSLHNRTMT